MDEGNLVVEKKPSMILEAQEAAKSIKEEREKMEKILVELKEIKAIDMLGGKSEAAPVVEEKKEISPAEYAEKALKGELNDTKE